MSRECHAINQHVVLFVLLINDKGGFHVRWVAFHCASEAAAVPAAKWLPAATSRAASVTALPSIHHFIVKFKHFRVLFIAPIGWRLLMESARHSSQRAWRRAPTEFHLACCLPKKQAASCSHVRQHDIIPIPHIAPTMHKQVVRAPLLRRLKPPAAAASPSS